MTQPYPISPNDPTEKPLPPVHEPAPQPIHEPMPTEPVRPEPHQEPQPREPHLPPTYPMKTKPAAPGLRR
jgi:hypothetical protein